MITFFRKNSDLVFAVDHSSTFDQETIDKLTWLFGNAAVVSDDHINEKFVGPRKEMLTPWSTNAVEITQNMGISGIARIEEFFRYEASKSFDPMLQSVYDVLDQHLFTLDIEPEDVKEIEDIAAYNESEGLALSDEEIAYLNQVSAQLNRKLTDSEVFGFSQVNSEHCRHKIFNGTFIIDGEEMPSTLFQLIKKTSQENGDNLVSAYKDNVAFIKGPVVEQFAPESPEKPDWYETKDFESVLSLKAETHNFPTTVEPFNGAATGSGGEIRDRLAGGQASLPLAGTAVYMTSYSRLEDGRAWENGLPERKWLYQTPKNILIKASNGASDFGNKFGQPLICGSVLTFEHQENGKKYGFDKVIMLAGGIGYGKKKNALKQKVAPGEKIVVLGGDNYRIGMGGGAVSSVNTGEFGSSIELNAVQRANPEMQKRVANAIRGLAEEDENPIISIHDHGAGGHLNCLSELVEDTGGKIDVNKLPVGDPTLSDKEIIGNESQERMGLVMKQENLKKLELIAERERAPMYTVGETTSDHRFTFENKKTGKNPMDWELSHMFGSSPKTILNDSADKSQFSEVTYDVAQAEKYLNDVLQLEAVACKDWLTNKVDRCVTGRVATQQTTGEIQLPLNNVSVMALDYKNHRGVATSIGHAPVSALTDPVAGSRLAIAEALTNLIWAPLTDGLKGVSLSANWMWPAKNEGENARLYQAVKGVSDFAIALGINIPTGKDSLSMTQKYPDGEVVYSPGTVIISSVGEVSDIRKTVNPDVKQSDQSRILYINLGANLELGGSSLAQVLNKVGSTTPTISDTEYFKKVFQQVQQLINEGKILAGHDVSSGGIITTLLEMCFPTSNLGMDIDLSGIGARDIVQAFFNESPALILQVDSDETAAQLQSELGAVIIGQVNNEGVIKVSDLTFDVAEKRALWFKTSQLLDREQSTVNLADERASNIGKQPLKYRFPAGFDGQVTSLNLSFNRTNKSGIKAAIIREKGSNSEREMAYMMHMAGFDVKDVHMTDLVAGREDLSDINLIVFVGGFSNSDVLGSAKGWAGTFLHNPKAKGALENFYSRKDTISLGVCNGCQLMMELGLIYKDRQDHPTMKHNKSGKFECQFTTVDIAPNNTILFKNLADTTLGIWSAHGEGRFDLPGDEKEFNIIARFSYHGYPANPNGSDFDAAAVASADGRHVAIMPHLERSMFPWNWPHYPDGKLNHEVTPWLIAFRDAYDWVKSVTTVNAQ